MIFIFNIYIANIIYNIIIYIANVPDIFYKDNVLSMFVFRFIVTYIAKGTVPAYLR